MVPDLLSAGLTGSSPRRSSAPAASPRLGMHTSADSSSEASNASNATAAGSPVRGHAAYASSAPPCLAPMGFALPEERVWLYHLVTFPSYFTPCGQCCNGSRTPKREQLVTHFDTHTPYEVYCSHCPEHKTNAHTLLQIRRSAFKDVVKASDICRFGADVSGVQQYTLNGSKVVYLSREASAEKKGNGASAAPAMCIVDGRAMMDRTSLYCSVKCKLMHEDPGFPTWLEEQDPALLAAAHAAQNAPPRPTVASKRAQQPTSSGGPDSSGSSGGSDGGASSGRPKKPRMSLTTGATSAAPRPRPAGGSAGGAPKAAVKSRPSKPAGAKPAAGAARSAHASGGLKPIRTSLPATHTPFRSAAAALVPLLAEVGESMFVGAPAGSGEWMGAANDAFALERAVSSSVDWQLPGSPTGGDATDQPLVMGSPGLAQLGNDLGGCCWGEGALSPVMGAGGGGGGSSGSTEGWWLEAGSADTFHAGMGFGDVDTMLTALPELCSGGGGGEGASHGDDNTEHTLLGVLDLPSQEGGLFAPHHGAVAGLV